MIFFREVKINKILILVLEELCAGGWKINEDELIVLPRRVKKKIAAR